ncbi:MAG: SRPBCC family protein [candidate division KSB1 bacterium]|nr:SRPBCC family protein [candidate division KSB1 bacterium]MDZ7303323.1 SRPBCC family protein [candidate division KSB1 bacterium]MDZ7310427.1 SRPBCC family protein [candidate division KSB1 bacterium]
MTVLSVEKILRQTRAKLWQVVSQFSQAAKWADGVEKTEHVSGEAANVGGVWRVHLRWDDSYQIVDLEITEWLEGERFGLRPLGTPRADDDIVLYQIVFNLKALPDGQTQIGLQCEYAPRKRMAKIKNLAFLRRQYLHRLQASLEALERFTSERVL